MSKENGTIQNSVNYEASDQTCKEEDQFVSDGDKYFVCSWNRGMNRGSRDGVSHTWSFEKKVSENKPLEATMLIHNNLWLVRHKNAPDVPFEVFDKETLVKKEGEVEFSKADSEEEDYLRWTPLDTEFEENKREGNRWMRASPMFSDGELIYMMVQYREKGFESPIVKTVCEVYSVSDDRKMTRIKEVALYKSSGEYYRGSKKLHEHGGHLSRGSIACNG